MNHYLQQFLESSTIHGLVYISTERKFARVFWVLVVIIGFSYAGYLINQSLESWSKIPFRTTIETKPITEIKFPKVTVCPKRNTYTDLNYDLMMLENMTMTNETKYEFLNIARGVFLDSHFENKVLPNISKLEENNMYYNWYHGYSSVKIPYWSFSNRLIYLVESSATSGSVQTQFFEDKYDPDKVERKLVYQITIYPPEHALDNPNCTMTLEISKSTMNVSGNSEDKMLFYTNKNGAYELTYLDDGKGVDVYDFNAPPDRIIFQLRRDVTQKDIYENINMSDIPGFVIKWSTNMDMQADTERTSTRYTEEFRREDLEILHKGFSF